jgi:hypothetical protein
VHGRKDCHRLAWFFVFAAALLSADAANPAPQVASDRASGVASRNNPPRPAVARLNIPRLARPPKIEDFLSAAEDAPDSPRRAMLRVSDFRQREPGDGVPVSLDTSAYLGYDDRHLYVVFVCRDEPALVRAHMAKREDIFEDDQVVLFLDTFHDHRRAYLFVSNPLGIQLDQILTEGQNLDSSFDTLWHSLGRLTADGYVVWMAIPFRSLRFPRAPEQDWGIGLARGIVRKNEFATWPHISARQQGFLQQLATADGLQRISPGRNVQLIPYGLYTRSRFLDSALTGGPDYRTDQEFRGGLDAKFVVKDALTFDVALNPDFSQVESDEPRVTVNRRFEVFFPERRPFFIENAAFFNTPVNLFFSRRIIDPQFGLRVTGKLGKWSFGGFGIDDRRAVAARPPFGAVSGLAGDCDPLDETRAAAGVVRVQREFAQQSTFGVFVSAREAPSCSNRVVSLDTRLKLGRNWVLTAQGYRTFTRRRNGSSVTGPGGYFELLHSGRHFTSTTRYTDRSPDVRAHLGFITRLDARNVEQFFGYYWRPEKGRLLYFGPTVYAVVSSTRAGRVQDWFVAHSFVFGFPGQTELTYSGTNSLEMFQNLGFRKHTNFVSFSTQWLRWIGFSAFVDHGTAVNYFPGAGQAPFSASSTESALRLIYRPVKRLRFEQTYIHTRLGTREGHTPAGFAPGAAIFNNHILRSKLNYQFTRELSLRAILDYNATLSNSALTAFGTSKRLTGDVLLTYLLHPGTALYLGYTDQRDNFEVDYVSQAPLRSLRMTPSPSNLAGRTFFVKLSYLFRF